jgi:hypothetical protein
MPRSVSYQVPIGADMGGLVEDGGYFTVNNGQTGIATAAAPTAFSDTNPFIAIYNQEAAGGKSIELDFLALIATAPGTSGTSLQVAAQLDLNVDRYTSGGSDLTPNIKNPNGNASGTSIAKVRAGNITASAKSSLARTIIGNRWLSGAIPVIGDTYILKFGAVDQVANMSISVIKKVIEGVPKIIIPPQGSCLIHLWLPAQAAASSYIPEMGWAERQV